MWKSLVILLSVVFTPCSGLDGFPQLPAPRIVSFDRSSLIKKAEVVTLWEFEKPRNISLRDVEFTLVLYAMGTPLRRFYPRFVTPPYRYTLHNVAPEMNYIVVLQATAPNWKNSEVDISSFKTLPSDWPAPIITEVSSRPRENFVEYSLEWAIHPRSSLLDHFEIRVCDKHCFEYKRNSTEYRARVPVEFGCEISISVVAHYDAADAGRVERESEVYTGRSAQGELEKILEVQGKQFYNTIQLAWHPPLHPRGPRSYYEVFACDPSNVTKPLRQSNVTEWINYKYASHLIDDVSKEVLGYEHLVEPTEMPANQSAYLVTGFYEPHKLPLRVVYKRTPNCVRFRILFEHLNFNRFLDTERATSRKELVLGDAVARTFNFSAYQRYSLSVHSCLTYVEKWFKPDFCGKFSTFNLTSNAEAPSEVVEPLKIPNGSSRMTLTWEAPKVLNGPLDGFEIVTEVHDGTDVKFISEIVGRNERKLHVKIRNQGIKYSFKIAAFNLDRRQTSLRLYGPWAVFYTLEKPYSKIGTVLLIVGFLLLMIILAIFTLRPW